MADIQRTDAAHPPVSPPTIYRKDYQAPAWLIPQTALDFTLGLSETRVKAVLTLQRNGAGAQPLRLDHHGNLPEQLLIDGKAVNWREEGDQIVIDVAPDAAVLEMTCLIQPDRNSALEGLYASNGMLCTQCEAEGFRRIIPYIDRPDNLSVFTVRMEADKTAFPILLSNGECTESGDLEGDRHFAHWHDKWPKPSYLFALVAGDLVVNRDSFTTMSGTEIELGIWVRDGDVPRTGHAMEALKAAMRWDEQVYGREYDLGVFNIVAVSDFNMGAMENKGLNVFNSRYILADPETATDMDYDGIEGVVAHEYFHNWSGNRVTCRDWFQLSLKEGFTVYRDQCFSADMGSPALQRISDVRALRAAQFPEDAGPMAHPIRPESYMEISNFYTATVYNKGAEVIRMMATIMGAAAFRKGTDLYFERHDGEAATCEDFVTAMEDGGAADLKQFRKWYETPGTPRLQFSLQHEVDSVTLTLSQSIGGQPSDLVIPIKAALLNNQNGAHDGEQLLILDASRKSWSFEGFAAAPILSINRGFSAPVIVETKRGQQELAFLSAHDDDPFARFEAMQQLMTDNLIADISGRESDAEAVIAAVGAALADPAIDDAFRAELVGLPSEAFLGDQLEKVDPDAVHDARERLKLAIATRHDGAFRELYAKAIIAPFSLSAEAKAARQAANIALHYIMTSGAADAPKIAFAQFDAADNMTLRYGALAQLAHSEAGEREQALSRFYERFKHDALVIDKWFSAQALSLRPDTVEAVAELAQHPDFTLANPNRVRALYGAFTANQKYFHRADGAGYKLLADLVIALDPHNPQTAARMVIPLGRWRRYEPGRAALMRAQLERIAGQSSLSRDTQEQVLKSLG